MKNKIKQRSLKINPKWRNILRANDRKKVLQEKAVTLLATLVDRLQEKYAITLNHRYLNEITKCSKDQNRDFLTQLTDVLDISYHPSIIINGEKYLNLYVVKHRKDMKKTLAVNIRFRETVKEIDYNADNIYDD
jgi:hypothetical protein